MAAEIDLEFGDGRFMFRLPVYPTIVNLQKARGIQVTFPDGSLGMRPKPFGQMYLEIMTGQWDAVDLWEIGKAALLAGGGGELSDGTRVDIKDGAQARVRWDAEASQWTLETLYDYVGSIVRACAQGYSPPGDKKSGNETPPEMGDLSTSEPPKET